MKYSAKRKKLRDELFLGEKVLVLAERIKKKADPGKFYKQSFQNISYFNKDRTFTIRKIQTIDGIKYYWLKDTQNNKNLQKDSKEQNYLLLGATLLCDRILWVTLLCNYISYNCK